MGSSQAAVSFLTNIARAAFGLGATVHHPQLLPLHCRRRPTRRPLRPFPRRARRNRRRRHPFPHSMAPKTLHFRHSHSSPHLLLHLRYQDLQMVNLTLRVLSRPEVNRLPEIFKTLGLEYDEKVLPSIGNEVLKAVVAQFNADQLLTERPHVSALVRESLIRRAKDFNIELDDVAITHLSYGVEFSKAVEMKQVAQQEAERSKFVVLKNEQEKRAAIIRAAGESEAARLISEATAKAGMGLIELRRIEASREIAGTLARTPNVSYVPNGNNLLMALPSMGGGR
ncbi:hypothetical protein L1049_003157 [Liquidambar formosana]|uniref:Prohibitin n=1 Tax=Liquidambar formosana TaxID=63359 RepID=A0AAP0NJM7_LIQFO